MSDRRVAARALAVLRLFLLPIVFAGDRLVAHPTVGTSQFDAVFAVACVYSVAVAWESWRPRGPRLPAGLVLTCDLLFVAALTYESGGAFSELHAAFLALPLGAALLLSPRRTAMLSVATGLVYIVVAVAHPAPAGHTGAVGGLLNMTRGFGTALGVALAGALFTAVTGASHAASAHVASRGLTAALFALACLALAAGLVLLVSQRGARAVGYSLREHQTPRSRRATADLRGRPQG